MTVTGELGIGKTRLVGELIDRARATGFRVLRGQGFEQHRGLPFGVFIDALDGPLGALSALELRRHDGAQMAELAWVLPSLASRRNRVVTTRAVERVRFHHAVRASLERLGQGRPLLLALDDVHWTDPASIELIAHLITRGIRGLALVLVFRTHRAPRPLLSVLAQASRGDDFHAVRLGPLSKPEAAELLSGKLGTHAYSELYPESGGNPFFLTQLMRQLQQQGIPSGPAVVKFADRTVEVPPAVSDAIALECDALSPLSQHVLRCAAVAEEPFDADLIAQIAEIDIATAHSALDELIHAGLLREAAVTDRLVFRHPVVRRTVRDGSGYGWRRLAHRRAATALAARGAAISEIAHHVERSAEIGDEAAVALLAEAGRAAAAQAPAAAARWFDAALRLSPDDASSQRRLSLLVDMAGSLAAVGRLHDAHQALGHALELTPAGATGTRGRLFAMIADTEQQLGHAAEAQRLLDSALEQTPPDGPEATSLKLKAAMNHLFMRRWDEAARLAHEAQSWTCADGDQRLMLLATAENAFVATCCGRDKAPILEDVDELARTVDRFTDEELAPFLQPLTHLIHTEVGLERWEEAANHARRGLDLCRKMGDSAHLVEFLHLLAVSQLMRGKLKSAYDTLDSVAEAKMPNIPGLCALIEATRCWVLSLQGRTKAAVSAGMRAVRVNTQAERTPYGWYAHATFGGALIEAGHHELGRRELHQAGGAEIKDVYPASRPHWQRALVVAELAAGRIAAADDISKQAEAIAASTGLNMHAGDASYARATVLLAQGATDQAASRARLAASFYKASGAPVEVARAHLLYGRILTDLGDTKAAETEFDTALTTFETCGATRLANITAAEQRKLTEPAVASRLPRRSTTIGRLGKLTSRETEIVNRLMLGHTNRQIAHELFVSEKTIEAHLTRLFARFGLSSRTALASIAAEQAFSGP